TRSIMSHVANDATRKVISSPQVRVKPARRLAPLRPSAPTSGFEVTPPIAAGLATSTDEIRSAWSAFAPDASPRHALAPPQETPTRVWARTLEGHASMQRWQRTQSTASTEPSRVTSSWTEIAVGQTRVHGGAALSAHFGAHS